MADAVTRELQALRPARLPETMILGLCEALTDHIITQDGSSPNYRIHGGTLFFEVDPLSVEGLTNFAEKLKDMGFLFRKDRCRIDQKPTTLAVNLCEYNAEALAAWHQGTLNKIQNKLWAGDPNKTPTLSTLETAVLDADGAVQPEILDPVHEGFITEAYYQPMLRP
mgnify:CR=1 FL=1